MMPFCPECGNENSAGKKFCTNCGSPLAQLPARSAPGAISITPVSPNPAAGEKPKEKSPLKTTMIIGIVIVIALIAAGVFFGLPLLSQSPQNSTGTPQKATPTVSYTPEPTVESVVTVESLATLPPETSVPETVNTQSGYKKYTNTQFGFSMDYPSDWEVNESNSLETPSLSRYNVVNFYSSSVERCNTDKSDCANVRATITVEVETAPGTKELADYFVPETAKILAENGAQITKRDALYKLSGVKAYRLDYDNEVNGYDQNLNSAYTLINDKAYILTYRAYAPMRSETNLFEKYYNTADDMFKSFQVQGAVKTLS
jgi:hypothetical protein